MTVITAYLLTAQLINWGDFPGKLS